MAASEANTTQATTLVDLCGEYRFKVDAKGRVALPSKFRKVLSKDLIVARELKGDCLYVFEQDGFNEWIRELFDGKFGGYNATKTEHINLRTALKSNAIPVDVDSSGRIVLSQKLRESVGIQKDVVIVGNTGRFEIWDANKFDEQIATIDLSALLS